MFRKLIEKGFTKGAQILSGQGKTTGKEGIKSFKPGTTFTGTPTYTKQMIKAKSEVQKKFKPINEGIANETRQLRQKLQTNSATFSFFFNFLFRAVDSWTYIFTF